MDFTFSERAWKDKRPKSAKGSGVASALKVVAATTRKNVTAMNGPEVLAAKNALTALNNAYSTASAKIKKDKKDKSRDEINNLIKGWKREIDSGLQDLRVRDYAVKVEIVQAKYYESYNGIRDRMLQFHAAALTARQKFSTDQEVPSGALLQNWMGSVRDFSKFASKQGIASVSIPEAKLIRVTDVAMPPDVKTNKTKAKELMVMAEDFAKIIKRGTKDLGAGVGDVKAADRELKGILADYKKILAANKKQIADAKRLDGMAKDGAGKAKAVANMPSEDLDEKLDAVKRLVDVIVKIAKAISDKIAENTALHFDYRDGSGDLAKRQKRFRDMDGYDTKDHGDVLVKAQTNCQLGIRRVTVPLANAGRQIDRSKRLLSDVPKLRGYIDKIPKMG